MIINVLSKSNCISINSWQRDFDSINSLCESLNIILNESNKEDTNDKRNKIKNTIGIIIGKIKTMYDNFISDYAYPFIIKCQKDFISKNIDSKEMKKIIDSFKDKFTINIPRYISYETFNDYKENVVHSNKIGTFIAGTTKNGNNDNNLNFISISGIIMHSSLRRGHIKDKSIGENGDYIPTFYKKLISNGEYEINKEVISDAYSTIFDNNSFINEITKIKNILIKELNIPAQLENDDKTVVNDVWSGINAYIQGMFRTYSLYLQTCMKVLKATIKKYSSQNYKED